MTRTRTKAPEKYYSDALKLAAKTEIAFMVGGAYAMREYADIERETKDIDLFCKAGDFERLLGAFASAGYRTEITDAAWLAKAFHGDQYVDLIFNSGNGLCPVDDTWFEYARSAVLLGCDVRLIPPEEELWTKMLVQDRYRFDGADVAHILRKCGRELNWERLLRRMEPYWEIMFAQVLTFRFIYPSERDAVPKWIMEELLERSRAQLDGPAPMDRVCRGPVLSRTQYAVDIEAWGYKER